MTDKSDDERICITCLAEQVAGQVLSSFTDACPDVKMSYDDWMYLGCVIEDKIKEALGVPSETEEADEKPSLQ